MSYGLVAPFCQPFVSDVGNLVLTGDLPDGLFEQKYFGILTLTGESGAVSVGISAGAVPVGVETAFDGDDVVVAGIPVDAPVISIVGNFPNGHTSQNYGAALSVVGAIGGIRVTVISGTLPPGLTLEGDAVILQGEPT